MRIVISLAVLLATAVHAIPLNATFGAAPAAFGVDSASLLSDTQAGCLARSRFTAGFFRLSNVGVADGIGVRNAYTANNAGLKFEMYVTPTLALSAATQVETAFVYAQKSNIRLNRVWLQVTNPLDWNKDRPSNVRFINDFVTAAIRFNAKVGFYTNWYDYEQITGNSRAISKADLWHWHVLGAGPAGQSSKDFSDFRTFGPFSDWPVVKQYGIAVAPCDYRANVNVFAAGGGATSDANSSLPIGQGALIIKELRSVEN
ncbi:unnamed protein product [Bursaphelenchus xylophilus]|uniref:(pine wood nematode) hypothetical protein n=1 Tax=Bursaphelenchus xylophilus TaxID=6326 RepID=A0A1I7RWW4_BURXY|nr:unnamed protein product [Bursaphelenchus xylophilus]CAG9121161.1 unnamed protein product [Bursaphelenchus xylophilus]